MLKKRIALGIFIIASGVFASFFGGAARTLFYFALLIPVFSFVYTFYVYLRFRVYQSAEKKIIVKGEKTPYFFTLADEDFFSYANVKVEFLEDFSTPQNMELSRCYHLSPKDKIVNKTEILCRYRGEYGIGIKKVIVTDFLGIMKIKYSASSTISMTVLPKITKLGTLSLSPLDSDAKLLRFSHKNSPEPPDCETRRYVKGDSIKLINWKLSAKKQELFVRQSSDVQNNDIFFIMDTSRINGDDYARVITEDKIIESALAIADYLVRKSVPLTIVYEQDEINSEPIDTHASLKEFYGKCAAMTFGSVHTPAEICSVLPRSAMNNSFAVFAVSAITEELCAVCDGIIRLGGDTAVLLIGEGDDKLSKAFDKRVIFKHIQLEDEICAVLGGSDEY